MGTRQAEIEDKSRILQEDLERRTNEHAATSAYARKLEEEKKRLQAQTKARRAAKATPAQWGKEAHRQIAARKRGEGPTQRATRANTRRGLHADPSRK